MPRPEERKSSKNKRPEEFLRYSGMATKMALVIGAAVYGGIKLDVLQGGKFPVWTLVLSLAGVAAAIYFVIRDTRTP